MRIKYPYIPENRQIFYVPADNIYIKIAKEFALKNSLDKVMPNASILLKQNEVIAMAANGSDFHKNNICQRIVLKMPTGQGYELCEGCHPKNHSEAKAIRQSNIENRNPQDADLYLWGHWWCCEPCWQEIEKAKIRNVFLLEDSHILFNKESAGNIVGRQFDIS